MIIILITKEDYLRLHRHQQEVRHLRRLAMTRVVQSQGRHPEGHRLLLLQHIPDTQGLGNIHHHTLMPCILFLQHIILIRHHQCLRRLHTPVMPTLPFQGFTHLRRLICLMLCRPDLMMDNTMILIMLLHRLRMYMNSSNRQGRHKHIMSPLMRPPMFIIMSLMMLSITISSSTRSNPMRATILQLILILFSIIALKADSSEQTK